MATGSSPPTPPWNGSSSPFSSSINAARHRDDRSDQQPLVTALSPRSAKWIVDETIHDRDSIGTIHC